MLEWRGDQYSIHGTSLRTVDEAKYLGVTIQSNLNWKPHINNISKKANSTLGFLRRNLRKTPKNIKEQAYRTYVRPTLEYSSSLWDPHIKDQASQIEMVQRRAARFLCLTTTQGTVYLGCSMTSNGKLSVNAVLTTRLSCSTASFMVLLPFHQTHHTVYLFSTSDSTRGHSLRFRQQHCRIQSYQYFPSVICLWNTLPDSVVSAPTLESFRSRLSPLSLR